MRVDVNARMEQDRWHWMIVGVLDENVGPATLLASCCDDTGGSCKGFHTGKKAKKAGWSYAKKRGIN